MAAIRLSKTRLTSIAGSILLAVLFVLLFAISMMAAPRAQDPNAAAQTGSITGKVIDAITHKPLHTEWVVAYDANGEEQQRTITLGGLYTLTELIPGPYRIRFGTSPYQSLFYSNSAIFELADWITVTGGVTIPNISTALEQQIDSELALATATGRPNTIVANRDGIFNPIFSVDNGQHWQTFITMPVDFRYEELQVALVPKEDDAEPHRFLIGSSHSQRFSTHHLFRSGDRGATWAAQELAVAYPSCDSTSGNGVYALATSPANPLRVYALVACTYKVPVHEGYRTEYSWAFHTSSDGGVTWEYQAIPVVRHELQSSFLFRRVLVPSPTHPTRIYAHLGSSYFSPWYRSEDSGNSWITETFTLTALALDWGDPNKVYGVEEADTDNIFRFTGKRSSNLGAVWEDWPQQPCPTSFRQLIALPTANTLLILCDQGLYRSDDAGDSWTFLTSEGSGTLWAHNGDTNTVLWVRGANLHRSLDQGATWTDISGWPEIHLPSVQRP